MSASFAGQHFPVRRLCSVICIPSIIYFLFFIQAMAKVYGKCHDEIGSFHDTKYIVGMLERSTDKLERDRLILFLKELMRNKLNVKQYIDAGGIRMLVELAVLSHMHVTRATVPLQVSFTNTFSL